jgi:hypothetical protein
MKRLWVVVIVAGCGSKPATSSTDDPPTPAVHHYDARPDAYEDPSKPRPNPDFPTPRSAGTEKLFTLEEPDRGPRAPTKFVLPPHNTLQWTDGQYCEDDIAQPACVKTADTDTIRWRVGRGPGLVVAERVQNNAVFQTYIYERDSSGAPTRQVELDAYGQVTSSRMFTSGGKFTEREPNGANALHGCGFMQYELDDKGFSTRVNCMQWSGAAMHDTHNVGGHRFKRDANGFVTVDDNLGTDGFDVVDDAGVHETVYDRKVRVVGVRYLDNAKVAVKATSGCFGEKHDYDAKGIRVATTCVDGGGKPVPRIQGYAVERFEASSLGCTLSEKFFGPDGVTPAVTPKGVHGHSYMRDAHCAKATDQCLGTEDRLIRCGYQEPAKIVYTRDAKGQDLSEKHYDQNNEHSQDVSYEAFELRYTWDQVGNVLSVGCWDENGRPEECSRMGFHQIHSAYDDAGHETEQRFFDEQGLATTNLGAAIRRFRYDNYDHLAETRNFNAAAEPFEISGYGVRRDIYDVAHRRAGFLLFDKRDQPSRYGACIAGASCPIGKVWHAVRIIRRVDGSPEKNEFFDENRQLIETYVCATAKCFD